MGQDPVPVVSLEFLGRDVKDAVELLKRELGGLWYEEPDHDERENV